MALRYIIHASSAGIHPTDTTERKKIMSKPLIIVKPENCVGCDACVRSCPTLEANKTIKLGRGKFVTTVNPDKCIACGECVRNCRHGARDYIDDTSEAMDNLITEKEKFIVIVAPAIKSVFPHSWKSILEWFRSKGCLIYDVSFGADICTWAHVRAIQERKVGPIISQPCAAIVGYIEKYHPELIRNLSPIHSPMLCAVTYIRKTLHRNERIIALSPCIAKANEFSETGLVEYNVTFKKLMEFFDKNGIKIPKDYSDDFKYDFEFMQGQVGAIYPRVGGLRDNIWLHDPSVNITTSEGVHMVYPELDAYALLSDVKKPEVFDVLSCAKGCNVGAGTGQTRTIFDIGETMREVEKEARTYRKLSGGITALIRGASDKLFEKFDKELNLRDYMRDYTPGEPSPPIPESEISNMFETLGKHTEAERNYDCNACGYRECHRMAEALCRGLTVPEKCMMYENKRTYEQNDELTALAASIRERAAQLTHDIGGIETSVNNVREANKSTIKRAIDVKNLMVSLRQFGEMFLGYTDADKVEVEKQMKQLVGLMDSVLDAFQGVGDFVQQSDNETKAADTKVAEIKAAIESINGKLAELNVEEQQGAN